MGDTIHPHTCRKTFASSALEENDLTAVAAALGHKTTATTSKYYTKISEQAKRNVAETPVFQQ
jgi:integrase